MFGEQFWRPYVHVRDAARAACIVLSAPLDQVRGEVFNVGSTDENYRKLDIVELLKARDPAAKISSSTRTRIRATIASASRRSRSGSDSRRSAQLMTGLAR